VEQQNIVEASLGAKQSREWGSTRLFARSEEARTMTHMDSNRCFGRLKARELSAEEIALVAGGDWEPDVFHSFICARSVSDGSGGDPDHVGCVYT
jgi:hypothetical protein